MTSAQTEYDVTLRLELAGGCARHVLEDLSVAVLDATEKHAAAIALGPVASAEFDPPAVEIDFNVIARSRAEVQQRAAEVIEIIEEHTALSAVVAASVAQRALVPA